MVAKCFGPRRIPHRYEVDGILVISQIIICICVTRDRPICAIGQSRMRHRASDRARNDRWIAQQSMDGAAL